jgi:hypothetical protein
MQKRELTFITLFALLLTLPLTPSQAAVKAGDSCTKAGLKSVASGKTFTCVKSGKKFVWDKGVAVTKPTVVSTPSATPTATPTPTPTPTPEIVYATLWEKYKWSKPSSSASVAMAATEKFKAYAATNRSASTTVKIVAQDGVDTTLLKWVTDGSTFVSKVFSYPQLSGPFVAVIAKDKEFAEKTYNENGYTKDAKSLANYFDKAPAHGGPPNTYNNTMIMSKGLLVSDKVGIMQMPGHETFHFIQKSIAGQSASPDGLGIAPQWFWEGPSVFIGLQAANHLALLDYATEGRAFAVKRSITSDVKSLKLAEVTKNDGSADPYGIGAIATEFLVANVGMDKFMGIYNNLGKNMKFTDAFKSATGVELADFYTMFEEVRADLGTPRS